MLKCKKKKFGWKYYLICYFKKVKNDGISFKSVTLIKRTAKKKEVNISNFLIEKVASVMINKKKILPLPYSYRAEVKYIRQTQQYTTLVSTLLDISPRSWLVLLEYSLIVESGRIIELYLTS